MHGDHNQRIAPRQHDWLETISEKRGLCRARHTRRNSEIVSTLKGIRKVVLDVLRDMQKNGEAKRTRA